MLFFLMLKNLDKTNSLTLSGFGLFRNPSTGRWETPTFMQMTENIKKLPITECLKEPGDEISSIICAGDGKSYAESNNNFTPDSCQGDSGGPLTYQDPYTKR